MSHIINQAFSHLKAGHIARDEYRRIYEATEPLAPTCAECGRQPYRVVHGVVLCAACVLRTAHYKEAGATMTTCNRHGQPAPALLHGEPCCALCVNEARPVFRALRSGGPVVLRRMAATEASRTAFLWLQALARAKRATGPREVATLRQVAHYWRQQTFAFAQWERRMVTYE